MQSLIKILYPPQCIMCEARTEVDFALCGACWGETPFIEGLCCNSCGTPLPGEDGPNEGILCDDCMVIARPWSRGRSVMIYRDRARRMVLSLKHGDRTDLAKAAAPWMARAAQPLVSSETLVVPVPLHRFRLLKRRFNQAALLAQSLAQHLQLVCVPDALTRVKRTERLDGKSRDQRFVTLDNAIQAHPAQAAQLKARKILLVDDVMTSGATFAAATEACFAAGADDVCVLSLARVIKDA